MRDLTCLVPPSLLCESASSPIRFSSFPPLPPVACVRDILLVFASVDCLRSRSTSEASVTAAARERPATMSPLLTKHTRTAAVHCFPAAAVPWNAAQLRFDPTHVLRT